MRAERVDRGRQSLFVSLTAGAALFAAGFVLGGAARARPAEPTPPVQVSSGHAGDREPTQAACSDARTRAVHVAPAAAPLVVEQAESGSDPELVQAQRTQQADDLVDALMARLNAMGAGDPDRHPEAIAAGVSMYQRGFVDALSRAVPELAPELGARIEQSMCDPAARPGHLISLAQVIDRMPELARERALDCVVERGTEDSVLWAMLDAWRGSGMPNARALSSLKASARDERTLRRLASVEDAPRPSSEAEE